MMPQIVILLPFFDMKVFCVILAAIVLLLSNTVKFQAVLQVNSVTDISTTLPTFCFSNFSYFTPLLTVSHK